MGEHLMTTSPLFLESESFNNNLNINHECVEVSDDEHSVLANASEADLIELISTDDIVQSAWIQTLNDNFDNPGQQQPLANTHDEQPLFTLTAVLHSSNKKRPSSSVSSSSSSSSSSEEDLDQGASPGKKLKKSDSERCREYRERKKKEKQSDDEELRSLEIKNY